MATLKGQNVRILLYDTTASKYKVVGMATTCTVSLTGNTEESSTKDDTGMSSKPTIVSKSWQVSVESLNVADVGAMLTAVKSLTPFTLIWDQTATTDNQTAQGAAYARQGTAYLSDFTMTYNDRENSVKSLQFAGASALETLSSAPSVATVAVGSYTKGQTVRLFLSSDNTTTPAAVVASAKQLSFHCSLSLENMTTKDTDGDWQIQEPTALSYDISVNALVSSGETITSAVTGQTYADFEDIYEASAPVKWLIANVSGDNNRTKGSVICSGSCVITSLNLSAANRQVATYDATLNGYGDYTVGS
jgi:hypothetical protein